VDRARTCATPSTSRAWVHRAGEDLGPGWALDDRPVLAVASTLKAGWSDGRPPGLMTDPTWPRRSAAIRFGGLAGPSTPTSGHSRSPSLPCWWSPCGPTWQVGRWRSTRYPSCWPGSGVPPDGVAGEEIHAPSTGRGRRADRSRRSGSRAGSTTTALVASVDVIANGRHAGRARLGLARPDLGGPGRLATSALGIRARARPRPLPVDERVVRVQLVARCPAGTRWWPQPSVPAPPVGGCPGVDAGGPRTSGHRVRRPGPAPRTPSIWWYSPRPGLRRGQLWLSELLAQAGRAGLPVHVVSPSDGPLRGEFEAAGMTVRITQPYPVDSLASYEGGSTRSPSWWPRRPHGRSGQHPAGGSWG